MSPALPNHLFGVGSAQAWQESEIWCWWCWGQAGVRRSGLAGAVRICLGQVHGSLALLRLQHLLETRRGFGPRPSLFIEFPRRQVCRSDQSRLRLSGVRGEAGMGFARGFARILDFCGIVLLAKVLGGMMWPASEAGETLGALHGHSQVPPYGCSTARLRAASEHVINADQYQKALSGGIKFSYAAGDCAWGWGRKGGCSP